MPTRPTASARTVRCPQCRARVPAERACRECGHALDSRRISGELLAKAERLYETYLGARVARARKTVIDLRARRLRNLRDEALLRQLRAAEKELRALEMQLMAQNARTEEAHEATGEVITEVIEPPADTGEPVTVSPKPTPSFRAAQAARAADSAGPAPARPFTAAQARRADATLDAAARSDHKVCPECEATLSPSALQCVCGYDFRLAKRQPAFLSEEELRILRGG